MGSCASSAAKRSWSKCGERTLSCYHPPVYWQPRVPASVCGCPAAHQSGCKEGMLRLRHLVQLCRVDHAACLGLLCSQPSGLWLLHVSAGHGCRVPCMAMATMPRRGV
jgi:hypothetical protein